MGYCSAPNCTNSSKKHSRMVRFPKDELRRTEWANNIGRKGWNPPKGAQLCIEHFDEAQFKVTPKGRKLLRPLAVPSLIRGPITSVFEETQSSNNHNVEGTCKSFIEAEDVMETQNCKNAEDIWEPFMTDELIIETQNSPNGGVENVWDPIMEEELIRETQKSKNDRVGNVWEPMMEDEVIIETQNSKSEGVEEFWEPFMKDKVIIETQNDSYNSVDDVWKPFMEDEVIIETENSNNDYLEDVEKLYPYIESQVILKTRNGKRNCVESFEEPHNDKVVKEVLSADSANWRKEIQELKEQNKQLIAENKELTCKLKQLESKLSAFLSDEQVASLSAKKWNWSNGAVVKGLKLRFALGKNGYNYLRSVGYPAPGYSTLNRRIQDVKFPYGVLDPLFTLLKPKVEIMEEQDKNCSLLVDEMEIASHQDFDPETKSFTGNVTLGKPGVANHYTVIMLRGLCSPWKQVVAHELTGKSTSGPEMKTAIFKTLEAAAHVGLNVRSITSDMGSCNKAFWSSVDVSVSRNQRTTTFTPNIPGIGTINIIADPPHLLKNMKSAFLDQTIILPSEVCLVENLPSRMVCSGHVKELWMDELNRGTALRSLHHLKKDHLFPSHFSKMNVALAVQLFSIRTAAAIEKAVALQQISKDALTTAFFIRLMHQWFEMMTARHPKCGITLGNKKDKFQFLTDFVNLIQTIQIGSKGWKPLQTGMIMTTLSVVNLASTLFEEGFSFFLPGRVTQDPLENVFSQVRKRSGSKPTALEARRALRLVCLCQFISDLRNTNYAADSDFHLLNFSREESQKKAEEIAADAAIQHHDQPFTALSSASFTDAEVNDIYHLSGVVLHDTLKRKNICNRCKEGLQTCVNCEEPEVPPKVKLLTEYLDMGGLVRPSSGVFKICFNAECHFQAHKENFLKEQKHLTKQLVQTIRLETWQVTLPPCCDVLKKVISRYLFLRCYGLKKQKSVKRGHDISFAAPSSYKKFKK